MAAMAADKTMQLLTAEHAKQELLSIRAHLDGARRRFVEALQTTALLSDDHRAKVTSTYEQRMMWAACLILKAVREGAGGTAWKRYFGAVPCSKVQPEAGVPTFQQHATTIANLPKADRTEPSAITAELKALGEGWLRRYKEGGGKCMEHYCNSKRAYGPCDHPVKAVFLVLVTAPGEDGVVDDDGALIRRSEGPFLLALCGNHSMNGRQNRAVIRREMGHIAPCIYDE